MSARRMHPRSGRSGLRPAPGSHDRDVQPAEAIRKADLRGADLRGVDFYLVDLRGARYTADQAEHLRRCRAILDDREA